MDLEDVYSAEEVIFQKKRVCRCYVRKLKRKEMKVKKNIKKNTEGIISL